MADSGSEGRENVNIVAGVDISILHMTQSERDEQKITNENVAEALKAVAKHGGKEQKNLSGVTLPPISLDRCRIESENNHPLILNQSTIEELSAKGAKINVPIHLNDATINRLSMDRAEIKEDLHAKRAKFTNIFTASEAVFDNAINCEGASFEDSVKIDEAKFNWAATFDDAEFFEDFSAEGTEFYAESNVLDHNCSFKSTKFKSESSFRQAKFDYVKFTNCSFGSDTVFQDATFNGDVEFSNASFEGIADFDEITVHNDAAFDNIEFNTKACFRGSTFKGGKRKLKEDATFKKSIFYGKALFELAEFRGSIFKEVVFEDCCEFSKSVFKDDARFDEVHYNDEVKYDEVRFEGDGIFTQTKFKQTADFSGAEFSGGSYTTKADVDFTDAIFKSNAYFKGVTSGTGEFTNIGFGGEVDFSDSQFSKEIKFEPYGIDNNSVYINFSRAKLRSGELTQPTDEWIRYDLTQASLGSVRLKISNSDKEKKKKLLDYFRFCRTEFSEFDSYKFDFGEHREYLSHNDWKIHGFKEVPGSDRSYDVELKPASIATTYLNAKGVARDTGETKTAGEFRVKRQQFLRQHNLSVVTDNKEDFKNRIKNFGRVIENYFFGISCGFGMRPLRTGAAFLISPLMFAPIYAFGGKPFETTVGQLGSISALATEAGQTTFLTLIHFSYVSYTTIGYGNESPIGFMARIFATGEAYLSIVLSALFVYTLIKRSEL